MSGENDEWGRSAISQKHCQVERGFRAQPFCILGSAESSIGSKKRCPAQFQWTGSMASRFTILKCFILPDLDAPIASCWNGAPRPRTSSMVFVLTQCLQGACFEERWLYSETEHLL